MKTLTDLLVLAKKVAETIVEQVPDCELILTYGGVARGSDHKYSDIDMIIIHDSKKVVWEFILNERPICCWSMTWKKAENTFRGTEGLWTMSVKALVDAKILWSKSKKHEQRFKELFKLRDEGHNVCLKKVPEDFENIYSKLWKFQESIKNCELNEISYLRWEIANALVHTLAVLNNSPFSNNWGKQQSEIANFKILPLNFVKNYEEFIITNPEDALIIGKTLVEEVKHLLRDLVVKNTKLTGINEITTEWAGITEYLNKIKSAAEKNDLVAAKFGANNFATFILWAYSIIQKQTWDRNHYYSVEEMISNLPSKLHVHISTLLQSNKLEELTKAAEVLIQELAVELNARGEELPIANTLEDSLRFIITKEI